MKGEVVPDVPDLYADGYSVNVGPFGVTVTFLRSVIDDAGQPTQSNEAIIRVRFSKELAEQMTKGIGGVLEQAKKGGAGPTSAKSH